MSNEAQPTLYVTGYSPQYEGCLMKNECTQSDLLDELTKLCPFTFQPDDDEKYSENNETNSDYAFRVILHKLKRAKFGSINSCNIDKLTSKYFALIRPPHDMKQTTYDKLFQSIRASEKYICNKLSKKCVYISGPQYDNFEPEQLAKKCNDEIDIPNSYEGSLQIEVIVHELDIQIHEKKQSKQKRKHKRKRKNNNKRKSVEQNSINSQLIDMHQYAYGGVGNPIQKPKFSVDYDCSEEPKQSTSSTKFSEYFKPPVFAFVWIHLRYNQKPSSRDDEIDDPMMQKQHTIYIRGKLPALSVMEGLNLKSYDEGHVYRVEMVFYDECYQNLPFIVDRTPHYKDIFLTLLQLLFLPFFTVYPPQQISNSRCCHIVPKSRNEHIGQTVPWDIATLWGLKAPKSTKDILFNFVSFFCTLVVWLIVVIGPFLYKNNYDNTADHLLFFDCFAPLLFYCLMMFTIVLWAGQTRECIPPKEHQLLYHQIMATIPITQTGQDQLKKTDSTPLLDVSKPELFNTYEYAHCKQFFELKTPTHMLLSTRTLKSKLLKVPKIIWMILFTMPYFVAQNAENFWEGHGPAYVSPEAKYHNSKYIYCIGSNIVSVFFVFCFIWLWETMFVRIERYRDNVVCLLELLIKTHQSETINLENLGNMLSWLELQKFVKGKGMILFASLESPLLSLWLLSMFSWSGFIYCIYKGHGLKDKTSQALISNSAWWTWLYLAILTGVETARMVFWYGLQFVNITKKIEKAIKSQALTMQRNSLNQYISANNRGTWEQKRAMSAARDLSNNINHDQIIPNVFGVIRFDNLVATAVRSLLISAIPTLFTIVYQRIH
eukprot:415082_1